MATVAFLVGYAWPILEPDLDDPWLTTCRTIVAVTWVAFVADVVVRLVLSDDRTAWVKRHPIDVAAAALPMLRPLRLLRLVALVTTLNRFAGATLRGRVGTYVAGAVTILAFVSALAVLDAERGSSGSIQGFGDALWWSMTTITTVGYGDTFPVTTEGRCIAVGLMMSGIAVLGVVTASIASWLIEQVADESEAGEAATRDDIAQLRADVTRLTRLLEDRT